MERAPNLLERCLSERMCRLRALLAERQVDALVVADRAIQYWLGHAKADLLLVTGQEVVATDGAHLAEHLRVTSRITLGLDAALSAAHLIRLQEAVSQARWKSLGKDIARLLAIKDAVEIALLRRAEQITCQVFARLAPEINAGRSELELHHLALETLLEGGGSGFSFDPSIAGGARSALPWAGVSLRRLSQGEPLLIDLGISFRGYNTDLARSFIVGGPAATLNTAWPGALQAAEDALEEIRVAVRPGAHCGELHALCERLLERAGFGGTMHHALGHGIGLCVHEPPTLAPGSYDILAAGMVLSLEPGITLGSEAGFRREEMVLVTEGGCESLTS